MKPRDFELKVRMNVAYHSERYGFLVRWIRLEKVVLLLSTTASIALLKSAILPTYAYVAAGFAALLTIWIIVSAADEACNLHRDFYSRWNSLHQKFIRRGGRAVSDADLKELVDEASDISAEEPPSPNTSVLIYSQNRVLREIGSDKRIKQQPWRRMLRNLYDGDADNLNPQYFSVRSDP